MAFVVVHEMSVDHNYYLRPEPRAARFVLKWTEKLLRAICRENQLGVQEGGHSPLLLALML